MAEALRASIIINNYNYGRFLGEAIESALRQTYRNTEVIVVDDGSTDNSRQVIESFGERVIPVFKANGGQGSAFNSGFEASKGEVICFLDSDDILHPTAIERASAAMSESSHAKVEWTLDVIDKVGNYNGRVIPEQPFPLIDLYQHTIQNGPFYDWLITPPTSGTSYHRRFLERVMPIPEESYRIDADVYLTVLAPIYGTILRLAESQGCYRQHGQNNFYGRRITASRLREFCERFEASCDALERHLLVQGVDAPAEQWRSRNYNYLWPRRLLQARDDLASLLTLGTRYVVVNNNEWNGNELVEQRHAIPFSQKEGQDWGPPPDSESAITQLEKHHSSGVEYIVFWWTCFWWLEHYEGLEEQLNKYYVRRIVNDRIIAFCIRHPAIAG